MADLKLPGPFWLIGCGNMAGAMLRRWLDVGLDPAQVIVIRPSRRAFAGVGVASAPPAGHRPALAMLGVKPQQLDEVAAQYCQLLGEETVLLSIVAGVERSSLRARFPAARAIVRAMPNTPVALGRGATSLYAEATSVADRNLVERLMRPLGLVEWIEDETLFDAVAALTASGPAFVFRFIDALAQGAAALGLPPEQARRLAVATVEGAGALAAASGETPHQLAQRVASPGGMTRQGLRVLDDRDALAGLLRRALEAAVRRSREMGEDARRA
jgi:pyrroline-5-carboxylate reductase